MSGSTDVLDDQERQEQLLALKEEIKKTIEWYETQAWRMQLFYVVLIAIGSVSGFLATTLLNLDWPGIKEGWPHRFVTALPAVGSLATLIVATFGIRDLWQMREIGTYAAAKLAIDVEKLSSEKGQKFETTRLAIKEELRQLNRRQALRVIGALGGGALDQEN